MEGKTSKFLQGCSSNSDSSQSLFLELPKYEQWSENNCASAWGVWLLTRAMPDPSLCSLKQCTRTVPKRFPDLSPFPLMLLSWGMCRIQWGRNITISSSQHFFPLGQLANRGVAREGRVRVAREWGAGNQACESWRGSSLQVTQLCTRAEKGCLLADETVSHHWG